jgi:PBP1b-binding outer membrane lipoprotein LpoB
MMMKYICVGATALMMFSFGCSAKTPPPRPVVKKQARPAPPPGPTRTDFKTIAKKLMKRCVAGGWIERWRSTAPDVDVAKPRIQLLGFEDKTGQDLDPTYLMSVLERRMRMSGVYDLVTEGGKKDFDARGRLLRMSERTKTGKTSVYTAILEIIAPADGKVAYSCEATVRGEI